MGCKFIYKDADGNPSAIYERALEKYGPEVAEEIYIRHMMSTMDTRFSKVSEAASAQDMDKRAAGITANEDGTYTLQDGRVVDRVTSLIDQYTTFTVAATKTVSDVIAGINPEPTKVNSKIGLEIGKEKQARTLIADTLSVEERHADVVESNINKAIAADPKLLENAKKDVEALWTAQNVWGTETHEIVAEVMRQWQIASDKLTPGKDGKMPLLPITSLYEVLADAKKAMGQKWLDEEGYDKFSMPILNKMLTPVFKAINDQSLKIGKRLILKPEVTVISDKFKDPTTGKVGIGGTIDLLLQTEDKSHTYTADFKTKTTFKAKDFDKATGQYIEKIFEPGLADSPENRAEAQQLLYATILSDPAYGTKVDATWTFVIPINFISTNGSAPVGEHVYKAFDFSPAQDKGLKYTENKLESIIEYFKSGDLKKVFEKARVDGIAGVTEKWSGFNEEGVPNATYAKDHKKSFIANRLISKKTVKGKLTIYLFDGQALDVSGMSDTDISELLSKKYDEAKETQVNIARDIVRVFYNPEDRLPKTLTNRQNAIGVLLKGIDKKTHDLSVAQSWMQELYGIGPDVLIAKNKLTGALSLLSAVTTINDVVKFRTDGSKEKRTSLLGTYKIDEEVISGSLSEQLMNEPTAHDFISMKLGIAAMYLHNRYKNNLKIENMRVVSMGFGKSTHRTETTIEEELAKIGAFRNAAGDDFPSEYAKMLDDINKSGFTGTTADHLKHLMLTINNNTDPLGKNWQPQISTNLKEVYSKYESGDKLVAYELKKALGNYLEAVVNKLKVSVKGDERLLLDERVKAVSNALLELEEFDLTLKNLASERNSTAAMNGAVSSGDKMQIRFHVLYQEASTRIRKDMDTYFKDHKSKYNTVLKEKGLDWIGNTDKAFSNMYVNDGNPENLMTLKDESDPSLSEAERNYIKFFNDSILEVLLSVTPPKYHEDIKNGRFWKRGTIPIIKKRAELLDPQNFKSWTNLKAATTTYVKSLKKKTKPSTAESFIDFGFATAFDQQATDSGVGYSRVRRKALGLMDPNVPTDPDPNIEKNLALILNMAKLESSEQTHYRILLQSMVAAQSVLASEGDRARTGMTSEMMNTWKDIVIFNTYPSDPIAGIADPLNRLSSEMLFSYSLRQAMIEFSTGTLQTGSLLIANSVKNAYASFFGRPEHAGRFTMADFAWGTNAWAKWDPKINQIVYDNGMLVADADDLRTEEFKGGNKFDTFKSEAGFFLNRLFFNSAITHTFLAQMRHLGIDQAYVSKDGKWSYDETQDPRFFAYDPKNKIGERAPVNDEEQKKYSLWKATREALAAEGMLDPTTQRMKVPMTSNERAEIKLYATRAYGSFNKDAVINGEAYSIIRSMLRYKKWVAQKIANYYTPIVRDEALYGHWEQIPDGKGGYNTNWVGDDFQGIIQTLGFMCKEIFVNGRGTSMSQNLNKYQLENLSKLFSDLTLFMMMFLIGLPLLSDTTEEVDAVTGETHNVKGDFAKSVKGDSAYKAATNATSDLFVILGMKNLTSNIFPGFGVLASTSATGLQAIGELIQGKDTAGETAMTAANKLGIPRTFNIITEPLTGN